MTRLRTAAAVLLATAAFAGCGDDGPTDPGPTLSLAIVSGNNQVGVISAALPVPLTVSVEDQSGNAVSGESVTWVLASEAGPNASVNSSSTTTGTDGQTSVTFTLGDAAGAYEVRAAISGSSVTFTAEATSEALAIVSGNGQVGMAGTQASQPLVVKAFGPGGVVVPDLEVAFDVTQSGGAGTAVSPAVATTGANGEASTVLTFGDGNGIVRVGVSAREATLEFSACVFGGDQGTAVLDLQPGEDVVISGADVSCVQLPAHLAGAEYEVVVTPLPQALGFNDMKLAVSGAPATLPAKVVVSPAGAVKSRSSFSPLGSGSSLTDWRDRQYEWDMQLRELEKPLRPQIQANIVGGAGFGLMAAAPQVGDVLDFGFSCVDTLIFENAPTDITAEVVKVSNNAVIFEDTLARGSFTDLEYDAIAQNFDDVIIGTDTLYFGAPADVQGDIAPGQVLILYSAGVNRMTENYREGFIAGFFCPLDLGFAGGNHAKMFYTLVPDPTGDLTPGSDANVLTKANVLRITDNTIAHELQHLINAQKVPFPGMEVWLNEGLSHLAEEVVGHATAGFSPGKELGPADLLAGSALEVFLKYYSGNFLNLGIYLQAPSDTAALLNSRDPIEFENGTFRMRGAVWSFVRYLLDRFAAPALEWQKTRELLTDGDAAVDSRESVRNVFGLPFNDLAADWSAMLSIEDRDDLSGAPTTKLLLTSYQLRAVYEASQTFGQYPLIPLVRSLSGSSVVDLDLFTATTGFVTLQAVSASGGTGLRLMEAGSGADLSAAIAPYMVIVRTK